MATIIIKDYAGLPDKTIENVAEFFLVADNYDKHTVVGTASKTFLVSAALDALEQYTNTCKHHAHTVGCSEEDMTNAGNA